MANENLPSEFISEKSLKTLSQASGAVYLVSIVLNFVTNCSLSPEFYRYSGLALSILAAVFILYPGKKSKSAKSWVFVFLNGILIFVNVSGMNSITADFKKISNNDTVKSKTEFYSPPAKLQAGLLPIPYVVDWWPNQELIDENNNLKKQNQNQIDSIDALKRKLSAKDLTGSDTNVSKDAGKTEDLKKTADSLGAVLKNYNSSLKLIDSLKKVTSTQTKNLSDAAQSKNESDKTIENLRKSLSDCEKLLEKLRKGDENYKKLQSDYDELQKRLKKAEEENKNCQKKLNELTSKNTNCDEYKSELSKLKIKYDSLQKELEKCKKSKDTIKLPNDGIK